MDIYKLEKEKIQGGYILVALKKHFLNGDAYVNLDEVYNICRKSFRNINKTFQRIKGKDIIADPKTPKSKRKILMPTHVYLEGQGLDRASIALCEQVTALDKGYLLRRMGFVYKPFNRIVLCHALTVQLGFHSRLDKAA